VLLAQIGGPEELGKVIDYTTDHKGITADERNALLRAVEEAVRTRRVGPPKNLIPEAVPRQTGGPLGVYVRGIEFDTDQAKKLRPAFRTACRLAGLWKVRDVREAVEAAAAAERDISAEDRAAALEGLALFGDANAKEFIAGLCDAKQKPEMRRLAIAALAGIDMPTASAKAAEFLAEAKPEPELLDLYAAFLSRKAGVPALAKALAGKKLNPDVAKLGLQAVRASTQNVPELTDALTKAGDLAAARKPPTPEEVKDLVADAAKGDATRGEQVYRRKELQCLACHAVGGAGGLVGPDMTSLGASAQPDYIVESLLIPNKAV
jgi:hypothetical protein